MIAQARAKKETEMCLPPFTDEASLALRRRLMEQQEIREFRIRESEFDILREEKLRELLEALNNRDESSEFLASQRIEAIRQIREEEKEKIFEKIRSKRIQVLRRLARQRDRAEPLLSGDLNKDIIDDYFDKGSKAYAPVKRMGTVNMADTENFNVASRTAPLDNMNNLSNLERRIPKRLLNVSDGSSSVLKIRDLMSKSAPGGAAGVAEERLTSVAQRAIRQTKRDVEEMHQILLRKKHASLSLRNTSPDRKWDQTAEATKRATVQSAGGQSRPGTGTGATGKMDETNPPSPTAAGPRATARATTPSFKKAIKRPATPDLAIHTDGDDNIAADHTYFSAVMLLQRLIRGRAVQNVMYEGRFRRRELIAELRRSDEMHASEVPKNAAQIILEHKIDRDQKIKETTIDAVTGGISTNLFALLSEEQSRVDELDKMQGIANSAMEDRCKREALEGGRRQREEMKENNGN
mmetsp:Transcript_9564/g.9369  ORF Transcript_9564/g.9369 Transcript_9564/m.9369 type:complete len:467 (-) Transcript_9564:171-1571(-)